MHASAVGLMVRKVQIWIASYALTAIYHSSIWYNADFFTKAVKSLAIFVRTLPLRHNKQHVSSYLQNMAVICSRGSHDNYSILHYLFDIGPT